jgi:hypothetical protein
MRMKCGAIKKGGNDSKQEERMKEGRSGHELFKRIGWGFLKGYQ